MEQIDRFRVVRTLGSGGFATVYLADDPALDTQVAIKVLAENFAADPDIRSRFVQEARVMRRLTAPGLVTVHDIGEHGGRPYIVMEFCERGTLADRLASLGRPATLDEALSLGETIARCVGHMHTQGFVHRDLKPTNLLIRRRPQLGESLGGVLAADEELVVTDFGLAKALDVGATRLTMAGGTPGYGAPEQFDPNGSIDTTADVYAASALIVTALTGVAPRPVLGASMAAFDPDILAATGPLSVPLTAGLSVDRDTRPADIGTWARSLGDASSLVATGANPSQPTQVVAAAPGSPQGSATIQRGPSRTRLVSIAAAIAVVLALSALALRPMLSRAEAPEILGPRRGAVGDEVVFGSLDGANVTWRLGSGGEASSPVVAVTPSEPGVLEVTAERDGRESRISYEIVAADPVRVEGPGLAPVGESTRYTATGPQSASATWTVDGATTNGPAIDLRPSDAGVIVVRLEVDGRTVERSITALVRTR
ncbi:MAG: serine/threonine protein kinase [Acidimicrobiia bacterium]|nr:serine/threonine protein kinase [Acidimicrobiia bacterium]